MKLGSRRRTKRVAVMKAGTLQPLRFLLLCIGLATPGAICTQAFGQKSIGDAAGRGIARPDLTGGASRKIEAWAQQAGFTTSHLGSGRPTAASQEIRLRWNTHPEAAPSATQALPQRRAGEAFTVIENIRKADPAVRQRAPRISSGKILVFALGAHGQLYHWLLIPDPRILRAEHADADGRLSGRVLHRRNPEFLVSLPEDPRVTELRFFRPLWTGKDHVLTHLATVPHMKPAIPSPEQ